MCSTGPIPGSLSHLQCYITCGIPKWKGGWHGRSDHVHNIRWTEGGWEELTLYGTVKTTEQSLCGKVHTSRSLADCCNLIHAWREPGNEANKELMC